MVFLVPSNDTPQRFASVGSSQEGTVFSAPRCASLR